MGAGVTGVLPGSGSMPGSRSQPPDIAGILDLPAGAVAQGLDRVAGEEQEPFSGLPLLGEPRPRRAIAASVRSSSEVDPSVDSEPDGAV